MDPAKLKVVELRAELSARGLDTKGNKPVLVKRLREAMKAETGDDFGDTSIADTTTEDLDSSAASVSQPSPPPNKEPDRDSSPEPVKTRGVAEIPPKSRSRTSRRSSHSAQEESPTEKRKEERRHEVVVPDTVQEQVPIEEPVLKEEDPLAMDTIVSENEEQNGQLHEEQEPQQEITEGMEVEETQHTEPEVEQEEQSIEVPGVEPEPEPEKETVEPRNRKSRWGSVPEPQTVPDLNQDQQDSSTPAVESENASPPRGEKRRHASPSPERQTRKRSRTPVREEEPEINQEMVQLSWIDSDLNLQVNKESLTIAEPMHNDGFGYMWAGVRSTHGIKSGKVWYEVKLLENCDWKNLPRINDKEKDKNTPNTPTDDSKTEDKSSEEIKSDSQKKPDDENIDECKEKDDESVHNLRVGWSLLDTDLQLGEHNHSYAFDSEGFSVTNSQFTEYGTKFAVDDVVGTFLNIETDSITISYTVNGNLQPTAFTITRSDLPEDFTFFAHILTRNIKFEINFGQKEEPWFEPPIEFSDYVIMKDVKEKVSGMIRPATRQECEVIMMVGLPCSGKTHWVNNHVQKNPEKKYNVLGLTNILDKMKHFGKPRKETFKGSQTVLMDKCTKCLSKLVDVASTRRRNYILDQTNLFSSAQRRKMRPFDGFRRQAVVIVVTDDEQSSREKARQQADGKDVPDSAVLEMKANMSLPSTCDWLDEVTFAELDEAKSKELVQKYNKQGREAGYGPNYTGKQQSISQRSSRRGSWSRNNERDSSRDSRNRWSGGRGHDRTNSWNNNRGTWGRHDNRNHHHAYRSNCNSRMMPSGGYNRNQGRGDRGYDRNRNSMHNRNSGGNKGGSWGGQGGGSWSGNQSGSWGNGGQWTSGTSGNQGGGGWTQGSWGQYSSSGSQGGGAGGQWKGYNAQQYQQYPQGYTANQYTNWGGYYGQYGWNQGHGSGAAGNGAGSQVQYQYTQQQQQQQAAWAQYAHTGGANTGYGYVQQSASTVPTGTGSTTGSLSGGGPSSSSSSTQHAINQSGK